MPEIKKPHHDKVKCEVCGKMFDVRGIQAHRDRHERQTLRQNAPQSRQNAPGTPRVLKGAELDAFLEGYRRGLKDRGVA